MVRHACFLPQIYINALNLVCGHALKAIERRTGLVWLEIFILLASLFMQQQQQEGLSLCKLYIYPSKAKEGIHILLKQGTKPTNMMCKYRQNFYKEENHIFHQSKFSSRQTLQIFLTFSNTLLVRWIIMNNRFCTGFFLMKDS